MPEPSTPDTVAGVLYGPMLALANRTARRRVAVRRTLRLLRAADPEQVLRPGTLATWTRTALLEDRTEHDLRRLGLWVTVHDAAAVLAEEPTTRQET